MQQDIIHKSYQMNTGGKKMGQIIGEGITFDDVLLVPSYSQVVPNQVDLTTWLTKKIITFCA